MVLDPSTIIGPSKGVASNITSGGSIVSDALPYVEFGGKVVGQSQGISIAGRSGGFGGQLISLKDPTERSNIYSQNVRSLVDSIVSQKRGEGYSQVSSSRLVKDLGDGTQSILDINPLTGDVSSTLYQFQQKSVSSKASSLPSRDSQWVSDLAKRDLRFSSVGAVVNNTSGNSPRTSTSPLKNMITSNKSYGESPRTSTSPIKVSTPNISTPSIAKSTIASITKSPISFDTKVKNRRLNNFIKGGKFRW